MFWFWYKNKELNITNPTQYMNNFIRIMAISGLLLGVFTVWILYQIG